MLSRLTRRHAVDDVRATLDFLARRAPHVAGMVGLSIGGHVAYLAAAHLDLPAVVMLYPGWLTGTDIPLSQPEPTIDLTSRVTARVLLLVGNNDQLVPHPDREQLREAFTHAGVEHELVVYPDVTHGFLNPRRASYAPHAAAHAWDRIPRFLAAGSVPCSSVERRG